MPKFEELHPEFRRNWPKRIEELLVELADLDGQRRKWTDQPERQAWDTYGELICEFFDDQQVEYFVTCYRDTLHPMVLHSLTNLIARLKEFDEHLPKGEAVDEAEWIESPGWKRCTLDAAHVLTEVRRWGWPSLD